MFGMLLPIRIFDNRIFVHNCMLNVWLWVPGILLFVWVFFSMYMYKQNDDPFMVIGDNHVLLTIFHIYARKNAVLCCSVGWYLLFSLQQVDICCVPAVWGGEAGHQCQAEWGPQSPGGQLRHVLLTEVVPCLPAARRNLLHKCRSP